MTPPKPRRKRVVRVELTRAEAEYLRKLFDSTSFHLEGENVFCPCVAVEAKLNRALKEASQN